MVFFQDMLQAHRLEEVKIITWTDMLEGEIKPEGEALVGPKGEVFKTFRYTCGIFSNTFYDFVSMGIWAPDP